MMADAREASPVVSPTLLAGIGVDEAACAPGSQWNLGVEGFTLDSGVPLPGTVDVDELLLLASQGYEEALGPAQENHSPSTLETETTDFYLLLVSQNYEAALGPAQEQEDPPPSNLLLAASQQFESAGCPAVPDAAIRRFGAPVTSSLVEELRKAGMPLKTRNQTAWSCRVWAAWASDRKTHPAVDECEAMHRLSEDITSMCIDSLQYWLPKFVLEARRQDKDCYPPESLYSICSGLQRSLKCCDRADVKLFSDSRFSCVQGTLDAEMKRLKGSGKYQRKKAEVISVQHEDLLWSMGLLGDNSPQVLLDTLVFYIGFYFAIRGGEHRQLRFRPSQLELVEPTSGSSYLVFTEFVSKTNQGGLLHRKKQPKKVVHHANVEFPKRCLVRLFKLYNSKCPKDRPNDVFYLRPLKMPKSDIWYQKAAVGHNPLANTVTRLFKSAGISGHYSNHSLRATAATRLFDAGVDEQIIMSRTGHSSADGVRSYKRMTDNLREKSSAVLNERGANNTPELTADTKRCKEVSKENADPATSISFPGATVNFHF